VTREPVAASHLPVRDPGLVRLTALVARIDGATRALARLATVAAAADGVGGLVLWWSTSGRHIRGLGPGTAVSLVVLALCLVPAGWLLNVRLALLAVLKLPETLGGVTMRRGTQLVATARRSSGVAVPRARRLAAVSSLRSMVRDYGDIVGSWATVAQVVTPTFWALTALALLAVPVLLGVGAVAGLVAAFT